MDSMKIELQDISNLQENMLSSFILLDRCQVVSFKLFRDTVKEKDHLEMPRIED